MALLAVGKQKNLNERAPKAVFMSEGRQLVAGELILGQARAAAQTNDEAVESLVREHARLVYRIAYAALRNPQDAEDAVQETFVRVVRYSHRLASLENPKTWLARIAWRVAVEKSRRRRRASEVPLEGTDRPLEELPSSETTADAAIERARLESRIAGLIAALPAKLREPLVLSAMEEMSPREVAAVLGINEAAVRSRVFRARQILKEKLAVKQGGR